MKPYYEHKGIVIYHGDCREILPQLSCVDTIVTDPPYGIRLNTLTQSSGREGSSYKGFRAADLAIDLPPIVGDDEDCDPAFLLSYRAVIMWGAIHYSLRVPPSSRWLIWDKRRGSPSDDNADCEMAWTNLRGQARVFSQYWRGWLREGEENLSIGGPKLHPAQKPWRLMKWCIELIPYVQNVCDPYMGSGTTLRAAKDLGHFATGIEIEERYCEIAAKRLSQEVLEFA